MIIRFLEDKDYEEFRRLFGEAYSEYLESLKHENPLQYQKESRERRVVSRARIVVAVLVTIVGLKKWLNR